MECSALPIKTKIQIMVQEVVRRLRNTHKKERKEEVEKVLSKFMGKLKVSGYSREHRWEILKSGRRRYQRMLETENEGGTSLNRPRWEGGNGRYWDKMRKKKNWYKTKPETGEEGDKQNRGTTL